jgi:hypothetical protein
MLKEEIEAIKAEFKDVKKIEDCVSNLVDAYLICIGYIEGILNDKKYVEFPEEAKEALTEEIDPDLTAIDVIKDKLDIKSEDNEITFAEKGQMEEEDADKLVIEVSDEELEVIESEISEEEIEEETEEESEEKSEEEIEVFEDEEIEEKPTKKVDDFEPFEYFVDFED